MLPIAQRVAMVRRAILEDPSAATPQVLQELSVLDKLLADNPLQGFEPHRCVACGGWDGCDEHHAPQFDFLAARTRIVAAFAGNRFGKTTALLIRALIECVDVECLPDHLRPFKQWSKANAPRGTQVRIVVPSTKLIEGQFKDELRRWCPASQLWAGSLDKAWRGAPAYTLRFANGSTIEFMSYEMDLDKFGGVPRHVVGYDEPPPQLIRMECQFRTIDYGGYEMFAMTPLKSAAIGWVKREIYKKREAPGITVVRGSIHDNLTLDESAKNSVLGDTSDIWRRAREYGDFVDIGGLVYPEYERWLCDPPSPELVRSWDVVVGIDPGIRNAGFSWHGFDAENSVTVFDEALLQDATVEAYVADIKSRASKWGLRIDDLTFVIDPASAQRSLVSSESVAAALMRLGIYTIPGQNNVEAGWMQIRSRGAHGRYRVSRDCVFHREQADDYAMEDREDGQAKAVKVKDHVMDADRYGVMYRPWDPVAEKLEAQDRLGAEPMFRANHAPPARLLRAVSTGAPPMGSMS